MGHRRSETGRYGGFGFSVYHARGAASRAPLAPHFHDEYLVSAQIRGDEQVHVGGTLHRFREGDVAFINPEQVHTGNARGDDIEYVSLYVDRQLVHRLAEDLGAPNHQPEFTSLRASRHRDLVGAMVELLALVQRRDQIARGGAAPAEPATALEIEGALHQVLVWAFEGFSNLRIPRLRSTARIGHRKIARVLDYLRQLAPNASPDEASLDRLAAHAQLSKYHFVRQFQRSVGMTPGAYLRRRRLCHAAQLLRRRPDPIVDIAVAVGFADHPSFSRAFARHMGMTPSQCRALGPV
ncbi:MAG: AraC family transcriptional regulator [Nannocystaceae bacterium]